MRTLPLFFVGLLLLYFFPAQADSSNPTEMIASQCAAMSSLKKMDGIWRGPAWIILPSGEKVSLTQTERIGPFLGGSVKVIEGRGYLADGTAPFNALGVISYDVKTCRFTLVSHAQGQSGEFELCPMADGYTWEIPLPNGLIRYTAVITDKSFQETGEKILKGKAPERFFQMDLVRISDTEWPAGDPVSPR